MKSWVVAILIAAGATICLGGAAYSIHFYSTHTCVSSHPEHQSGWTQMIPVDVQNGLYMPIYHPARVVDVCDQWEVDQ